MATNLINNPSGVVNTNDWVCSTANGNVGNGTSPARTLGAHLSLTRTNASGFLALQNQQFIVCSGDTTYTLTVYAQSPTIPSLNIGIRWLNSGFSHLGTTTKGVTAISSSGWTTLIHTVASPTGAAYALPEITQQAGGTISDVFYIADTSLILGSLPGSRLRSQFELRPY